MKQVNMNTINLKVSNALDELANKLAQEITTAKGGVFQPIYIVTQTEGMNNWLKTKIAEENGIAANLQFVNPNKIIEIVYQLLGGLQNSGLSTHDMSWLLFKALDESAFKARHARIAAYYHPDLPDNKTKRMALAEKIADLFDQYQIYRSNKGIAYWNRGKDWKGLAGDPDQGWQKDLWLRIRQMAGDDFPDKTTIDSYLMTTLKNKDNQQTLQQNIPQIYFFGLSLLTQYHLKIIHTLAKYIDIQFLMQNPAPEDYWLIDESEKALERGKEKGTRTPEEQSRANPLLVEWGKLTQKTFNMLDNIDDDIANHKEDIALKPPIEDNLLHQIQYFIYHNQKTEADNLLSKDFLKDETITISSCYSPIREVDALYNYLVYLIDEKGLSLSPRDIVVQVTDIDRYAPYIKAVFYNAPYRFPFSIADESYGATRSMANALHAVLSMTKGQFSAENVMTLLEYPALRQRFQINDVEQLREWVAAANIRFGIDNEKDNDTNYVSWRYGLKRMMYGICMSGSRAFSLGHEDSFYPLDLIEGSNMQKAVRLMHFVETLIHTVAEREKPRSLKDWIAYVETVLLRFIGDPQDEEDNDYKQLKKYLERYHGLDELYTDKVSYELFSYNFLPALLQERRSRNFGRKGITFCSLIPMRSIPFKVVALLGMDYDKFPRQEYKISFDLLQKPGQRQPGDRNIKDNDKHLFLETLLSAEDYFYVSYVGQSIKDNETLPAATLVEELLDFIANGVNHKKENINLEDLITRHPLHRFSTQYNHQDKRLYSYLLSENKKPFEWPQGEQSQAPPKIDEIPVYRFVAFLKNPFKGYYNQVIGVFYEQDDLSLPETEVFDLNPLEKWTIKNDLLTANDINTYRLKNVKLGHLPLKNMGEVEVTNINNQIQKTKADFEKLIHDKTEKTAAINLSIDAYKLTGTIKGIYGDTLVRYSFSKKGYERKHLLEAYLEYLIVTAAGQKTTLKYISTDEGTIKTGVPLEQDEAKSRLSEIMALYQKGHQDLLPFHPDFEINNSKPEDIDQESFNKKINNHFNGYYPCTDFYQIKPYKEGFFNQDHIWEDYKKAAKILWWPVKDWFEKGHENG